MVPSVCRSQHGHQWLCSNLQHRFQMPLQADQLLEGLGAGKDAVGADAAAMFR